MFGSEQGITMPSTRLLAVPPREIARRNGTVGTPTYFHFPDLVGFANGAMLATMTKQADAYNIPAITSGVYSMGSRIDPGIAQVDADIFFASAGEPTIAVGSTIVAMQYNPQPVPDNGSAVSTFKASRRTWSNGGATYAVEVDAVSITGFPSPLKAMAETVFRAWSLWFGKIITASDGSWLGSAYVTYDGASLATAVCLRSTDLGYTWTYRGEICSPADAPLSVEGATETGLVRLANDSIMAIVRTPTAGSVAPFKHKVTSSDSGATWGTPAAFDPVSGASSPSLIRIANGKVVMSLGYGNDIYVLFSSDSGATFPDRWYVNPFHNWYSPGIVTTAYVPLVEVEPNRVCMAYDEIPTGRASQPNDGSLGPNKLWMIDFLVA